jgi:hypothetical protein
VFDWRGDGLDAGQRVGDDVVLPDMCRISVVNCEM